MAAEPGYPVVDAIQVCGAHAALVKGQEELARAQEEIMGEVVALRRTMGKGFADAGVAVQQARDDSTAQVSLVAGRLGAIETNIGKVLDHVLFLARAGDESSGPKVVLRTVEDDAPRRAHPPLWLWAVVVAGAMLVGMAFVIILGPKRTADLIEDGVRSRVAPMSTPVAAP